MRTALAVYAVVAVAFALGGYTWDRRTTRRYDLRTFLILAPLWPLLLLIAMAG